MRAMWAHWEDEIELDAPGFEELVAAGIDAPEAWNLMRQFDIPLVLKDVKDLKAKGRVQNIRNGQQEYVPSCRTAGGGFSCKDASKQNKNRSQNRGDPNR